MRRVWLYRLGLIVPIWLVGCLASPDPVDTESVQALNPAGTLETPALMSDIMADWFTAAGVSITPVKTGSTAAISALTATPASQSFAALMRSTAPAGGYRYRKIAETEGIFAVKAGATFGALTTADAQQFICPVSGGFASTVGGVTPSMVVLQDVTPDATDSVTSDLCGAPLRTLRTGTILVSDGAIGRQWNGSAFVNVSLSGFGKFCSATDNAPTCTHKNAAQVGVFAYGDSRIQLGSGVALLQRDGITPLAPGYPGIRDVGLVDKADPDPRHTGSFRWLDGDGTIAHPSHHAAFLTGVQTRGLIPVASF
jgi:hypothetical protein